MKKTLLIFVIYSIIGSAYAQELSIGAKINSGIGRMHSGNLQESFKIRKAIDDDIIQWEANSKFGFNFGIGGFAEYKINDSIALVGELSYNFSNSTISIGHIDDDVEYNGDGDGDIKTIQSEATIKLSYLQLPLLAKYYFKGRAGPYAIAGFGFNFIGTPKIESFETKIKKTYDNFSLVKTTIDTSTVSTGLNEFNSIRSSFIFGAGTVFELNGRNLFVDIRFDLPLNKTVMYTTDEVYDDIAFKNNDVFSILGKIEAESEAPAFRLEDFKLSLITISIGYTIYTKSNIQDDK